MEERKIEVKSEAQQQEDLLYQAVFSMADSLQRIAGSVERLADTLNSDR